MDLLGQLSLNSRPGTTHEPNPAGDPLEGVATAIRFIAFYLPQFHPIALNDAVWGKGFTEWTNVTKALPRYVGQYQPHLPSDLGFYDLRQIEVLRDQAALARRFGIYGFCFHHYWFSGQPLLETPLANLLHTPDIDLPFCINWANESWTRTWDGAEQDIIMEQRYENDDALKFADAITPILKDPRYIRIGGKPLVMFYRPGAAPDAAKIVNTWRERLRSNGIGDCYLVMPQTWGDLDPRVYGLDAACGMPPHNTGFDTVTIHSRVKLLDQDFAGEVRDYGDMVRAGLAHRPDNYDYFPGVCPGWDNEARRPCRGFSFHGSTPAAYEEWLLNAARQVQATQPSERQIVFINAWNEWAEGAHLEPDLHHGHAYLAATARALRRAAGRGEDQSVPGVSTYEQRIERPSLARRARLMAARTADRLAALLRP
jgi:lipopolysaccharide biosynthesis protein